MHRVAVETYPITRAPDVTAKTRESIIIDARRGAILIDRIIGIERAA
jgi:hypothetical protein